MGLLDRGRKWSNRVLENSESVIVDYFRKGEKIATIPTRVSPPVNVIGKDVVVAVPIDERDFIVNRSALVDIDGQSFLPKFEDRIVQVIDGVTKTFVVARHDNEAPFSFRDGGETSIRIRAELDKEQQT